MDKTIFLGYIVVALYIAIGERSKHLVSLSLICPCKEISKNYKRKYFNNTSTLLRIKISTLATPNQHTIASSL